jgi:hypothetical protein
MEIRLLDRALAAVEHSELSFCKYITANDTGSTGAHQAGFHFPKKAWPLFFDSPGVKGNNKDKQVEIFWNDEFFTQSRFIYYGSGTRNEYRLTRFGRGFPFLKDENIGNLLLLCRYDNVIRAYVLYSETDIEDFLAANNISLIDSNSFVRKRNFEPEDVLLECHQDYLKSIDSEFPKTSELAEITRKCYNTSYRIKERDILARPDSLILEWGKAEYLLFKGIEDIVYKERIRMPFKSVADLVDFSSSILNRRKSRAGKSLEYHLSYLFDVNDLKYSSQCVTEDNKKPDYIFPGISEYHDSYYDRKQLVMLAAKTTCKDRWRQILNEAEHIKTKYLFTLQQGISSNQITE